MLDSERDVCTALRGQLNEAQQAVVVAETQTRAIEVWRKGANAHNASLVALSCLWCASLFAFPLDSWSIQFLRSTHCCCLSKACSTFVLSERLLQSPSLLHPQADRENLLTEHRAAVADLSALREALAAEGAAAKGLDDEARGLQTRLAGVQRQLAVKVIIETFSLLL